jgi:hypothetical protein
MSQVKELKGLLIQAEHALNASRNREAACMKELDDVKHAYEHQSTHAIAEARPLYVTTRRLEKFRDRPKSSSDISVHEWIADMSTHLEGQSLSKSQKAAVILEHLAGVARL